MNTKTNVTKNVTKKGNEVMKTNTLELNKKIALDANTLKALAKIEDKLNTIPTAVPEANKDYIITGIADAGVELKQKDDTVYTVYSVHFKMKDTTQLLFVRLFTTDIVSLTRVVNEATKNCMTSGNGLLYLLENELEEGIVLTGYHKEDPITGQPSKYVNVKFSVGGTDNE